MNKLISQVSVIDVVRGWQDTRAWVAAIDSVARSLRGYVWDNIIVHDIERLGIMENVWPKLEESFFND